MSVFAVPGTNDEFEFDGPNRRIVVGAGTSVFHLQYVYSFWKRWLIEDGAAQYVPAFRVVGGDDLGGGNRIAFYAFLINGWRILLPDELKEVIVTAGILATEELDNPFVFSGVLVVLQQPINVQFIASIETQKILTDIDRSRTVLEDVVAPEIYYMRNTVEKTLAPATLSVLSPVSFAEYDPPTGIVTVTCGVGTHNLEIGDRVHVTGIAMTCDIDQGETTVLFPDIELGSGTYPNPGDISQPYIFNVIDTPSEDEFTFRTGITTFNHFYTYGGVVSRLSVDLIADQLNVGINTIPALTSSPSEMDKIQRNTNLIPALV